MRPGGVILTAVCAVLALGVTVWVGRYQGETPPMIKQIIAEPEKPIGPEISPTGPHPKAVPSETEYVFGAMNVGSEGTHKFVIKNEGEADLELVARKEDTTCSCTFGELSKDGKIPPGESVEVTLNWKIKAPVAVFRHSAKVRTNDPQNPIIELVVTGKVEDPVQLRPSSPWELGEVLETGAKLEGVVFSNHLEQFALKETKVENGLVAIETRPMTPEELTAISAKSGYHLTVRAEPTMPIGTFHDSISLTTDAENMSMLTFRINGSRPGAIEIFGPNYVAKTSALKLGEFPADKGKTVSLSLFARDFEEDLVLEGITQKHDSVKVEVTKDEKVTGKARRYVLKITVPPGAPQNRLRDNAERIDLKFNHPKAPEVRLYVEYLGV